MNDEYALDPAIASQVSKLKFLLSKFGVYEGRFISRFPARWIKLAFEGITDQNDRYKLQLLMERCEKEAAFIRSNRTYDGEKLWVVNASEQHDEAPFTGLISTEARPGFIGIDEVDPTSFSGSRDARVTGSIENMMKAIRPLIEMSSSLYLVDPYFWPCEGRTCELLAAVLAERRSGTEFRAFVSSKHWPEVNLADKLIQGALPSFSLGKGRFNVQVCDDQKATLRLHARYLFSDRGGVRLDKGLCTDEAVVDLSYIDKGVHEDLMLRFVKRPLPFNVVREYSY